MKRYRLITIRTLLCIVILSGSSCHKSENGIQYPDSCWPESTPEEQGVDSEKLDVAMNYLASFIRGRDSVKRALVIRNGFIIWSGSEIDSIGCVFSVSKLFATTILGHLTDSKKCSLDSPVADIVRLDLSLYPQVTLHHLITMTSGYNAEGLSYTWNGVSTPYKPVSPLFQPGEYVEYNDHAAHLLGYILTKIVSKNYADLEEYFRVNIARPIGIKDNEWHWERSWPTCVVDNSNPDSIDICSVATGVWISPQALARLGYLYLNLGKWGDNQIISEEWVVNATSVQIPSNMPVYPGEKGASKHTTGRLGYLWWINDYGGTDSTLLWDFLPKGSYAAIGAHNNWCWIIPEWNMVVVRTGSHNPCYVSNFDENYNLFLEKLSESIVTKD